MCNTLMHDAIDRRLVALTAEDLPADSGLGRDDEPLSWFDVVRDHPYHEECCGVEQGDGRVVWKHKLPPAAKWTCRRCLCKVGVTHAAGDTLGPPRLCPNCFALDAMVDA